jgi:hypothetical protein
MTKTMTFENDDKVSGVSSKSEQDRSSSSTIPTRVGRNAVDINVPALKHLVDTVKEKLK